MTWFTKSYYFLNKKAEKAIMALSRSDGPSINIRLRFVKSGRLVCHHDVDGYSEIFGSSLIGGCDPKMMPERLDWYIHISSLAQLKKAMLLLSAEWRNTGNLPDLQVECWDYRKESGKSLGETTFMTPVECGSWIWRRLL